ncbi:MAG: DUF6796 family protein [Pseudomonadota bacterium]
MDTTSIFSSNGISQNVVRGAGLLAVAGGVVNAFSDYLLQGGFVTRAAVNTYADLANAPYELVAWGSIVGNAALPFWLLGFLPLYIALAPAGRWFAMPPIACLGYVFTLFPGYHGSYALYAAGFQASSTIGAQPSSVLTTLSERLHSYHDMMMALIGVFSVSGSILFAAAVLSGRTLFSRWIVLLTPLIVPLTQPFIEMLPAPFGGIIRPPWGTVLFSLLFLAATVVTWNHGVAKGERHT